MQAILGALELDGGYTSAYMCVNLLSHALGDQYCPLVYISIKHEAHITDTKGKGIGKSTNSEMWNLFLN